MFTMLKMLNSKLEYSVLKDYFSESLSVEVSKYRSSQKDDETEKQTDMIIMKLHNILSIMHLSIVRPTTPMTGTGGGIGGGIV